MSEDPVSGAAVVRRGWSPTIARELEESVSLGATQRYAQVRELCHATSPSLCLTLPSVSRCPLSHFAAPPLVCVLPASCGVGWWQVTATLSEDQTVRMSFVRAGEFTVHKVSSRVPLQSAEWAHVAMTEVPQPQLGAGVDSLLKLYVGGRLERTADGLREAAWQWRVAEGAAKGGGEQGVGAGASVWALQEVQAVDVSVELEWFKGDHLRPQTAGADRDGLRQLWVAATDTIGSVRRQLSDALGLLGGNAARTGRPHAACAACPL